MAQTNEFAGSVPELYDRYMGPMLFEPYGREMAGRFAGFEGDILETACGTGRVTRALAEATAPGARITATDYSEPMLAQAMKVVASPKIVWKQADATALPFADASFDALVCQFGAMFFPDKAAGYSEARRVLRKGGRYVFSVWDDIEANDLSIIAVQATDALFADNPADFMRRGPFGYHDEALIRTGLEAGGFAEVEVERVVLTTPAASARHAALAIVKGSPLGREIEEHHPGRLDEAVEAAFEALFARFGEGPVNAKGRALVVTARA
ncbi:MAG TPA: class I SAM-dependent methyltransferase [Caulobacteraceae bacterium]